MAYPGAIARRLKSEFTGRQFPIPRSPRLEPAAMDVTMAISVGRDQILSETGELVR